MIGKGGVSMAWNNFNRIEIVLIRLLYYSLVNKYIEIGVVFIEDGKAYSYLDLPSHNQNNCFFCSMYILPEKSSFNQKNYCIPEYFQ
jgi:hypothetical protein